jgi:hypothetical protein
MIPMSPISIALEIMLAVLLVACLFYCWRLDRKLTALRSGEQGIRAAAAELNAAVAQADGAIRALRKAMPEATRETPPTREAARDAPRIPVPRAAGEATRRRSL